VTGYTQPCNAYKAICILRYLPREMNHLPGGDGVFAHWPYLRYEHTLAMRNLEFLFDLSVVRRCECIFRAFFCDVPANDVL
jgi:hypothetical protein